MNRRDWSMVAAIGAFGVALSWQGFRKLSGQGRGRERRRDGADGDGSGQEQVTAAAMAREAGIRPNVFRAALRAAELPWHDANAAWTVVRDSAEHRDMVRVLEELLEQRRG